MRDSTAMESKALIFKIFGETPPIKIVNFLLSYPKNEFTIAEIIKELSMSKVAFYKYFDNLLDVKVIISNPEYTKSKLYRINLNNPLVHSIRNTVDSVSEKISDKELLKLKIKPVEFQSMKLQQLQDRIVYLKKLERQTKTEIKKLEKPLEI